mgnify:FL=1
MTYLVKSKSKNLSVKKIMKNFNLLKIFSVLLLMQTAMADQFIVKDMRVEGLRRISEGTVFNYLPINVGDSIDENKIQESIKSLYREGLFDDIESPTLIGK